MKKIAKKIFVVLISCLLAMLMMSATLFSSSALPTYNEDVYIADMLSNNYRGNAFLGEPNDYKWLTYYANPDNISASQVLVDALQNNADFWAGLGLWETATFNPSDTDPLLMESDFYKLVIAKCFDVQFSLEDYTEHYFVKCGSVGKAISDLDYSSTDFENYEELKKASFSKLPSNIKNSLINNAETQLKKSKVESERYGVFMTIVDGAFTVAEYIETASMYINLCSLETEMKNILNELYTVSLDYNIDGLTSALYDFKECVNDGFDEVLGKLIKEGIIVTTDFTYRTFVGMAWDALLASNPYTLTFRLGQALGKTLSEILCSSEQIFDQTYIMIASVNFEKVMAATMRSLQSKYKSSPTVDNAADFLTSVDLLFSCYEFSCDYTYEFAEIIYDNSLVGIIKSVNTITDDEFKELVTSLKKDITLAHQTILDIVYYTPYLEVDYPDIFANDDYDDFDHNVAFGNIEPSYYSWEGGSDAHYKLRYRYVEGGIGIVGYESLYGGEVTVPSRINGTPVVSIGSGAFAIAHNITKITLPESVEDIGAMAFSGCRSLESINIPSGITKIRPLTFSDCSSLKGIEIPDGVTAIDESAFKNCTSLNSVVLPDTVERIYSYAFYGCTNMVELITGDGTTEIGEYALYGCTNLEKLIMGKSVIKIGKYAFHGCINIEELAVPAEYLDVISNDGNAVFTSLNKLVKLTILPGMTGVMPHGDSYYPNYEPAACYNNDSLIEVVISDGVKTIPEKAFYDCSNLKSVNIGVGLTEIPEKAFMHCGNLTSITIPESLTYMGEDAFYGCSKLINIFAADLESWLKIRFKYYPTNIIENDIRIYKCTNPMWSKRNLYFNGVLADQVIGDVLIIPDGITEINAATFLGWDFLTSVIIPDTVTKIGRGAFSECYNLKSITLGNGITSIGVYAFSGCSKLSDVYAGDLESWLKIEFSFISEPVGRASAASNPMEYADRLYFNGELAPTNIIIPDTVTEIKTAAFSNCWWIDSIVLPEGLTSISFGAFNDCNFKSITFPSTLKEIKSHAFFDCRLQEITFLGIKTELQDHAFSYPYLFSGSNGFSKKICRSSVVDDVYFVGNSNEYKRNLGTFSLSAKRLHTNFDGVAPHYDIKIIKQNTCTQDGSKKYSCSCGYSFTETDEATGHNYENIVISPTCTNSGYTLHSCINCSDSYKTDYIYSTGHKYTVEFIPPTCIENGYTANICSCGYMYKTDETQMLGHSDTDFDNICDSCSITLSDVCSCNCHKSNKSIFSRLIWKILRFFFKIFKFNRNCACGIAYY